MGRNKPKQEYIKTNLRRYTFENKMFKKWVEVNCGERVLNLFAGKTRLNLNMEVRNDIDKSMDAEFHIDAVEFVRWWASIEKPGFDTIICDPPYSYRKSMEMYKGNRCSRFKQLADEIPTILNPNGNVISFGYHDTFLGKIRGFGLKELCVFGHGGAQHCTIGIVEGRI